MSTGRAGRSSRSALIPRPNRIYGFALPQILQGIQEEADTQHNQRLNWMDMLLQPVRWRTGGVRISEEDKIMGPGTEIRVMKKDDFGWYDYPDRSQPTVGEEADAAAVQRHGHRCAADCRAWAAAAAVAAATQRARRADLGGGARR